MQKLWLKNFEFSINPVTWNTAQDLVQAGAVRQLQEVEKHFWVVRVRDGDMAYEVEAMITPHKIKAFTCECWEEGRRLMCSHVAAGLLKVRQFLEQQNESRQAKSSSEKDKSPNRLTVPAVLSQVASEDVQAFVSDYARRDRDFALALKTWFAGKLNTIEEPFLLVIDAALPRHAGARPLRDPELRRLLKVLVDLDTQMSAAVEKADAVTVFQISTAILQKTSPLLSKLEGSKSQRLAQHLQKSVTQLLQLSSATLSPELQEKRQVFLFDYLLTGALNPVSEQKIISFLRQAASDKAFFKKIRDLYDQTPTPAPAAILHLFISALAQRKLPEAIVKVLQDYADRPSQVKAAIEVLYWQELWEATLQVGTHFLDQQIFSAWQQKELEDWLLAAAEKSNEPSQLQAFLRRRYRNTGDEALLNRLKKLSGDNWPQERDLLLRELQAANNIDSLAKLLAAEEELDALAELLKNQNSLVLLQQYENALLPKRAGFVRDYYIEHLSTYLSEHFGLQATEHILLQLKGLIPKGQVKLAKEIVAALIERFPDRQSLPEELATLFAKTKRHTFLSTS